MSAQKKKTPGTAVRLFSNLEGQRVRLGVVAVSIVLYVGLAIWTPMYSAVVVNHLWERVQDCWRTGAPFTFGGGLGRQLLSLSLQYLATWLFYYLQSYLMASVAESLVAMKDEVKVPMVVCWAGGTKCAAAAAITRAGGLPTYPTPDRAVHALDILRKFTVRGQIPYTPMIAPAKSGRAKAKEILDNAEKEGRKALTEAEGKEIFAAYDLPTPGEATVTSADEAAAACNRIGYPVVMKIISPDIQHKTDVGGVVVGVKDEAAARAAYDSIMTSCAKAKPEAKLVGVSIQQMVSGKEVILSMIRDPQFGPVISFGLGGIFVEILREISQAHVPMSEEQLDEMIKSTKAYKLMSGARGMAKSDIEAMKDTIRKFVLISVENP